MYVYICVCVVTVYVCGSSLCVYDGCMCVYMFVVDVCVFVCMCRNASHYCQDHMGLKPSLSVVLLYHETILDF